MPSAMVGISAPPDDGVVGRFRRNDPGRIARAELGLVLGEAFGLVIGEPRRRIAAGSRDQTDEDADDAGTQAVGQQILEFAPARQHPVTDVGDALLGVVVPLDDQAHRLRNREEADQGDGEVDAAEEVEIAEGEARRAGRQIHPDHRQKKTQRARHQAENRRSLRQRADDGDAENGDGEDLDRAEIEDDLAEQRCDCQKRHGRHDAADQRRGER